MEHLLTLQGKDHLVAVVPLLADASAGSDTRRSKAVDFDNLDTEALNSIGTAARIIQLTRVAQVMQVSYRATCCFRLRWQVPSKPKSLIMQDAVS